MILNHTSKGKYNIYLKGNSLKYVGTTSFENSTFQFDNSLITDEHTSIEIYQLDAPYSDNFSLKLEKNVFEINVKTINKINMVAVVIEVSIAGTYCINLFDSNLIIDNTKGFQNESCLNSTIVANSNGKYELTFLVNDGVYTISKIRVYKNSTNGSYKDIDNYQINCPNVVVTTTQQQVNIGAKVLFPLNGASFINVNNQEAAKIVIAQDGLTITDLFWNTIYNKQTNGYNSGQWKRWSWNTSGYFTTPLTNYTFDSCMSGMPVNIRIELMNPDNTMNDVYMISLILGGQRRTDIGIPSWFSIPTNRLGWDYMDLNSSFPRNWNLPSNKVGLYMADEYINMENDGTERIIRSGWTARMNSGSNPLVIALPHSKRCWIDDDTWMNVNDPTNTSQWSANVLINDFGTQNDWVYIDGEHLPYPFTPYIGNLQNIISTAKQARPNVRFGAYHTGDYWRFNSLDNHVQQRLAYNDIPNQKDYGQIIGYNTGRVDTYAMNNFFGERLYGYIQQTDFHNISGNPNPLLYFYSHQMQPHPGDSAYSYQDMLCRSTQGKAQYIIPPAHPNIIYATALFAFTLANGMLHWNQRGISEDPNTLVDWFAGNGNNWSAYIQGYQGTVNFINLAMWQASQNADILEANTQWVIPEFCISNNDGVTWNNWRTGDDIYPSYARVNQEPIVRVKYFNGSYLIVACNPFNKGLQKVKIRINNVEIGTVTLASGFPVLKRTQNI